MGAKVSETEFLRRARALHPTLDFSKTEYQGSAKSVTFTCPDHGEQSARANNVLLGRGCPLCGRQRSADAGIAAMQAKVTPEQRAEMAAKARASQTSETRQKMSEAQRKRWSTDAANKQAQADRGKKLAAARWEGLTPEERKAKVAAERAAKQHQ